MKKINLNVKKFGNVILFLFCLNWSAQIVYGQQNRSVISGYVFDSRRNPVTQIPVELMNDLNSVIQRTKTDGSGRFFFSSVPSGRFTIRVLPLGTDLEQQTQDVEIAGIGVSGRPLADNVQLDFYLRPRKNSGNTITNNGVVFVQEIPEEAKKVFEKAVSDLDDKRIEAGIEGLENALKLFPTYYLALEKLGGLYIGQQKYDKARDIFSRAVTVNERSFIVGTD